MHDRDPLEGEYQTPDSQAPQPQRDTRRTGGWGTLAAGVAVIVAKFKTLLLVLLQAKWLFFGAKLLGTSWTFLLSLWFYALAFGWQLGIVLALALLAHELGHYYAYKGYGLAVRAPVFVPFMGAFTAGAIAPDLEQDAYIALAGPVTGLALAFVCYAFGVATHEAFWYACADLSAFLNLFNMIPVLPFDGGRVIGAVWPPLRIVGVALFVVAAIYLHVPIFLIVVIALMGIPAMLAVFRGSPDPRAAAMTFAARARVSVWYLATTLALIAILGGAHAHLPATSTGA